MNLKDDIKPISYIKTNAADMLKRVNETRNPIVITQNGEARAVLMDTGSYQSMISALGILKLMSQSEKEIDENLVSENDEVFGRIEKRLKNEI
jgi:prevent-host-death family protein